MTVTACPECDSANIQRRVNRHEQSNAARWYCRHCGVKFGEPVEREAHTPGGPKRTGLPRQLLDMDPDEVPP